MGSLSPIPIPPAQRWREFRIQFVPIIVFVAGLTAAGVIWLQHVRPSTLTGEVEKVRATVSSHVDGSISEMNVTRFEEVTTDEPLAQIQTTQPEVLNSSLAVIRAEIELLRSGMSPAMDKQRALLDYEQLRLDWMRERVELATVRVQMQQAENEYRRLEPLFEEQLVSEDVYDQAQKRYEALKVQSREKTELVKELEQRLKPLSSLEESPTNQLDPVAAAIAVQEEQLRLTEAQLRPVTLKAPINGVVSEVHRRQGESVRAGDPILTISSRDSQRIIGYLTAPTTLNPEPGDAVEVTTRGSERKISRARILKVGVQMEPITNMALANPNRPIEVGLPILVSKPNNLELLPGEVVDINLLE